MSRLTTRPVHAVVPAAGRGTRLAPLTDEQPKPLVEVADKPLLAHALDALAPIDPESYVVVIGYRGEQIRTHFGQSYRDTPIRYVRQPEPIGLADAVRRAGEAIRGDPFVVCNGDNVLQGDLTRLLQSADSDPPATTGTQTTPAATLLVEERPREQARETGVIVTDDAGRVEAMVEKPDDPPSTLVSAGAYAFSPAIVAACDAIDPAATNEYELADAITHLLHHGHRVETVELAGDRVNVNDHADLERAEKLVESSR